MEVVKGSNIKLDYEGRLESGAVFDSSKHGDHSHPLEFEVGSGQVIPGFDSAVLGMKVGDEKEFSINPEEGYGEYDEKLERKIPIDLLPKDQKPKAGMILVMKSPDGRQVPVNIKKVDKETVTIDLNHPLAGKKLIFKIKILEVN